MYITSQYIHSHIIKNKAKVGDFPVAENYYENTLTLPMYSSMSNKDFDFIVTKLKGFSW